MKRAIKCECGGRLYDKTYDDAGSPTWACRNCYGVTKRIRRVSAKRRRLDETLERLTMMEEGR
jgi:hypothetical protein